MDTLDHMRMLREHGQSFVLATVVRVEKPTSARPGAQAIITADGLLTGWIGGSCAEPTVKQEAAAVLQEGTPRLLRLCPPEKMGTQTQEGVTEVKLTCMSGGTLEIYLEPHLPRPHLLVIGHHPIVESLTVLGKALDFSVTVMGLDISRDRFPAADEIIDALDFSRAAIYPQTCIVVASHGNYDEPALELALPSPAGYVALVASRKRSESVRTYLAGSGLSEAHISRLKYPAGIDIGAATPQEIALSILAEIIQLRRQKKPALAAVPEESVHKVKKPKTALDVICGMTVVIDTARFTSTYDHETYYFCSAQCKRVFEEAPQKYVQTGRPAGDRPAGDHPAGNHPAGDPPKEGSPAMKDTQV